MDWKEDYEKKMTTPEEAAKLVKSGDQIIFTLGRETQALGLAIAARIGDLKDVKVLVPVPGHDFGWYDSGWEDFFKITIFMPSPICQQMLDERRCDINVGTFIPGIPTNLMPDVTLVEVTPPDEHGFCRFGLALWRKKDEIRRSKITIAEVNDRLSNVHGEAFIHVSEIDCFVKHPPSTRVPGTGSLAGRALHEPEPYLKDIAKYVNSLINDGDTIQIGAGRVVERLVPRGMLDGKKDLGWHSEATPRGIINLIKEGVINGKKKTIDKELAVITTLGGGSGEEVAWGSNNPIFKLVNVDYLESPLTVAKLDNFVAINQVIGIDLMGQSTAESIGTKRVSQAGGQIPFVIGALLAKGGRSITVARSTAKNGEFSTIVSEFQAGTAVTNVATSADNIITEYGIARLRGKSMRERSKALIKIAHPKFRDGLKEAALKRFWPEGTKPEHIFDD